MDNDGLYLYVTWAILLVVAVPFLVIFAVACFAMAPFLVIGWLVERRQVRSGAVDAP